MFWRRQPRAAQIFVGVGAPYAPRSAKRLLHFRSSAAAAQEQRRYYISAPSYRTPTCRRKRNPKPWFWRRFLHTFCRCWQKVCLRRQDKSHKSGQSRLALPTFCVYPAMITPFSNRRPARAATRTTRPRPRRSWRRWEKSPASGCACARTRRPSPCRSRNTAGHRSC